MMPQNLPVVCTILAFIAAKRPAGRSHAPDILVGPGA
jgi:hypothetical protein